MYNMYMFQGVLPRSLGIGVVEPLPKMVQLCQHQMFRPGWFKTWDPEI